ncbi:single-stranded DNA-binding protein (plasmid) [Rathayibacter sp. VKM Ac-2759]|uniref:single-stranded DNA-binding protein n=1 Tax=Rathayibacter sp. VKM Ac-2759 TaxID=2609252 RepID=UPI0013168093|nr:single-stranded DNA-binding protein [Rathayibacter sp. VKM Ac-2759]QHC68728.1 single-stranded DNA-binding protein [Rathayibacter sp. VKM Ac-2759]
MTGPDVTGDDYRAGYLAGRADRQGEVDWLENEADRYYRLAYGDERRLSSVAVTRAELEQRRALSEPPVEVTRRDALASWGIETPPTDTPAADAANEIPPTSTGRPTNRTSRRRQMSTRTITGNLATDPEAVQAGRVQIVKLRVIENTGEFRGGEWTAHEAPTTHFVEAKFELGEHVLASLHKGDGVIVVGYEHTVAWGEGENRRTGRVIEADAIGPNLTRATAVVTTAAQRTPRRSAAPAAE